jgi:general stress protein YciG
MENNQGKSQRGLGSASEETRKRVASQGGRAAHEQGKAHEFTSEEAREAGRKGGEKVSRNREYMREIGRKGGENSGGRRKSDNQSLE